MNDHPITNIAIHLERPGTLWTAEDDIELQKDLLSYVKGELAGEDAEILAELIDADPQVAAQFERCREAVRVKRSAVELNLSFFTRLSAWLNELWHGMQLQTAYADQPQSSEEVWFEAVAGDPYRACIVKRASGLWALRVFTSDAAAAQHQIEVGVRDVAPVLSFEEAEKGLFYAEVEITDEMASALNSGTSLPTFKIL